MKLTSNQIAQYIQNGFVILEKVFSDHEIENMRTELVKVIAKEGPRKILERNGAVRSFFAPDLDNELFKRIVRSRRLVEPAEELVGTPVYIHQTKLNTKHAMIGDWWEWHQDYTFWKLDDGMPGPNVLTAMVYLNDVNEFNGPMLLIPGSHMAGVVNPERKVINAAITEDEMKFREYQSSKSYLSALTTDLKYTIDRNTIAKWARSRGLYSAKGQAGSVLLFHGNVFHASSNNMSPWDRHTLLITYNSISNILSEIDSPRPAFIANRDYTPLAILED